MSVQSEIDRLNAIKERIRTNLVAQGVTVPSDTMLDEMAEQILSVAGEDGETPYIGANGNWWIGETDTGVQAQGPAYTLTDTDKSTIAEAVKGSLTPEDIGAAAASHTQAASTITAGTFAGEVVAKSSAQTPGTSLLRNCKLVSAETDPTVNGEICWLYE